MGYLLSSVLSVEGCTGRFPVSRGRILTIAPSDKPIAPDDDAFNATLQIRWFGTACHDIRLGHAAILTDPFFTYHKMSTVAFGRVQSDPALVHSQLEGLPAARAIFVGHSHYDHMLDVAAVLEQGEWSDVPVFGSKTTHNILHGYGDAIAASWTPVKTNRAWHSIGGEDVAYQAIETQHAPQLPGVLLYPGRVDGPRQSPPHHARHFPVGETYAYLFKLTNARSTFTVYFVGSAAAEQNGYPGPDVSTVDVAILCVPGWKNVTGYPAGVIRRLRPRYVVLSHFDNFFEPNREAPEVVPTASMREFLDVVQQATVYDEFEGIIVPDVGSVVHIPPRIGAHPPN